MTDIEERLTAALRSVGDDAPVAAGLAGAARERRASRRRTTVLTSAAAVAAMVAVVGGVTMLGSSDDSGRPPFANDATPTVTPTTPSGRVETWRDVSVTVPADWGYGSLSTWCLDGATEPGTPVVERPGGARELILCEGPANGYGVQFSEGAVLDDARRPGEVWQYLGGDVLMFPEGAWLGYQRTDHAMVQVVAPSRDVAEQVLGSFERVTDLDANGCPARPPHAAGAVADGSVRLCRFSEDGWLEQSETLTGASAADAMAALDAAPVREPRNCAVSADLMMVRVASATRSADVHWQGCTGVFGWGDVERDLTSDVLYWMLSPGWSGGVEGDVPMPDQLRH